MNVCSISNTLDSHDAKNIPNTMQEETIFHLWSNTPYATYYNHVIIINMSINIF